MTKNKAAQALGSLGGLAAKGAGAKKYWASLDAPQRREEMLKRVAKRKGKKV